MCFPIRHLAKMLCITTIFLISPEKIVSAGTFYNPVGTAAEAGTAGATSLNKGLSHFHLVLAAVENQAFEQAKQSLNDTRRELNSAVKSFQLARDQATDNALDFKFQDQSDKAEVERFMRNLDLLKIKRPNTQKDLANIAVVMTRRFLSKLSDMPIGNLKRFQREIHEVIRLSLTVQNIGLLASRAWSAL